MKRKLLFNLVTIIGLLFPLIRVHTSQAQTPVLPGWHSLGPLNMDRPTCFDRAVQALQASSLSNIRTQEGWYASATNSALHGAISCVQSGNTTFVDVVVAGASGQGNAATQMVNQLRDYMLNGVPTTTNPGTDPNPGANPNPGGNITWTTSASAHRGKNGQRFSYTCPAGPVPTGAAVWGTDIYTDDSSICKAAVHAGRITAAGGGVIIEIRAGQSSYASTERNGITTSRFGSYSGSFVFVNSL
jgi:hypothetical protein